jgi:hypothetical protein
MYGIDTFGRQDASGHTYDANNYDTMIRFKTRHSFDSVHVIVSDFASAALTWARPVDIIHIDGTHTLVRCPPTCALARDDDARARRFFASSNRLASQEAVTNDWNAWVPKARGQPPQRTNAFELPSSFFVTTLRAVAQAWRPSVSRYIVLQCSPHHYEILKFGGSKRSCFTSFPLGSQLSDGIHFRCFQDVTLFFRAIKSELVEFMRCKPVSLADCHFFFCRMHGFTAFY